MDEPCQPPRRGWDGFGGPVRRRRRKTGEPKLPDRPSGWHALRLEAGHHAHRITSSVEGITTPGVVA